MTQCVNYKLSFFCSCVICYNLLSLVAVVLAQVNQWSLSFPSCQEKRKLRPKLFGWPVK